MARKPRLCLLILAVTLVTSCVDAELNENSHYSRTKPKHFIKRSKSKAGNHAPSQGNPWPFLPSAGSHHTAQPGFPCYPFMIVTPPNLQTDDEKQMKDAKGSKYFTNNRGFVSYPPFTGYIPVYYMVPQYGAITNPQDRRQIVPRHHWAFSQWPFDSHEYAFAPHSPDTPHLPRWGPHLWAGAGPGKHWAINREGLPSPFGIGLAPHMGGQNSVGLDGQWPQRQYPTPKILPKLPFSQFGMP